MMQKLLLFLLLSVCAFAAPVRFAASQDVPPLSRVVIVNGEEKILMPDGRILPLGQGVICSDECLELRNVAVEAPSSLRRFSFVALGAFGALAVWLWLRDCCCELQSPPIVPPASPPTPNAPPPVAVPEASTLSLLLFGLMLFARRRKH